MLSGTISKIGPDAGHDVGVEPAGLVAAVAPHALALPPPAAGIRFAVEPSDGGHVARARRATGEEGEVGDRRSRRKDADSTPDPARPGHGGEVWQLAPAQGGFGHVWTESVHQQENHPFHDRSVAASGIAELAEFTLGQRPAAAEGVLDNETRVVAVGQEVSVAVVRNGQTAAFGAQLERWVELVPEHRLERSPEPPPAGAATGTEAAEEDIGISTD